MAESKPFETAVKTVNSKIATTKHLHLKTKKIIEEGDLETALANIQKKNFTLTSANHLAAILIKIIEIYVNKNVADDKKAATFIKYIKLLQKGILDLFTVKKILTKLSLQKLYTLIEKKYGSISDEAETILRSVNLNGIGLDKEVMKQFDTTNKQIDAAKGGLLTSLQFEELSNAFKNIKSVCKESFGDNKFLKSKLTNSLPSVFRGGPQRIDKDKLFAVQANLFNEFAYLYYVIHQEYDQANTILEECHKDAVRKLLTARRRIEQAYKKLTPIPEDLPELRPATQNTTPTATTEQKTPSTLPRPGRPAPKDKNDTATTPRQQYKKGLKAQRGKKLPPPPKLIVPTTNQTDQQKGGPPRTPRAKTEMTPTNDPP